MEVMETVGAVEAGEMGEAVEPVEPVEPVEAVEAGAGLLAARVRWGGGPGIGAAPQLESGLWAMSPMRRSPIH